ncbi:MAG: DUF6298 domain-containing protein [Prevotellaceae bacterium]|jgi:hypothetical protein|nr:DUF6298 domain-containing protein [Prevotellaceae bacterium]
MKQFVVSMAICTVAVAAAAQKTLPPPRPVEIREGQLMYTPDERGNRVPDFSYAGYMAGEKDIPTAEVRVRVPPVEGDATAQIQRALDYVASLPPDKNGLRGAVLLEPGVYRVDGALRIGASGVVLRGSGVDKTTLLGSGLDRQTLITITGKNDRALSSPVRIADAYVPVGATQMQVEQTSFEVGDNVLVQRPSTQKWIQALGADHFGGEIGALGWKAGNLNVAWDRTVIAVNGDLITVDAPVTTAIDTAFGGGFVAAYRWPGRVSNIGVENLSLVSSYDEKNEKDEAHRWMAIVVENAQDVWVRQVNFAHFAGSAVAVWETAKRVTVEDCKSLHPVSEVAAERRYSFYTMGQQTLFQRCYAEHGYHDFAVGYCSAGPNAFVQCEAHLSLSFSGAVGAWASGALLDVVNIDGNALGFFDRNQDGHGAGWTAANSMMWQCTAAKIYNARPPTAQNWAIGSWAQFAGNGYWSESNNHVQPRSLYYAQLEQRLGRNMQQRAQLIMVKTNPTSSPTVAQAAELVAQAKIPVQTLSGWIDSAAQRNPIPTEGGSPLLSSKMAAVAVSKASPLPGGMEVADGKLVRSGALVVGERTSIQYWGGSVRPNDVKAARPHITRYVPGRTGLGYTDDLEALTDEMPAKNIVGIEHHYGLWYERRRDDHERIRRMDGEVWPPFYEQPFARSGEGLAWDGLSKYDLTRYNHWYWLRLKQLADLADRKGLLLVQQHYFQHNIIEAGAHWADSPWRAANNVNGTDFPEPPPYAGDKRIFMAEQFYDTAHPARRALHVSYIRKCLNNFEGNSGVIHLTSGEFTGPLPFVQFWLDVIADWEKETGRSVLVGLSATKDVQDAILSDTQRASVVDIIDIRYWWYQQNGEAYAPQGGLSLAPRQHVRLLKPLPTSFAQVYRAVAEYREKFPGKAVIFSGHGSRYAWAELMAGGSLAPVPVKDVSFLTAAAAMHPLKNAGVPTLYSPGKGYIAYVESESVTLDLTKELGKYKVRWIDAKSGDILSGKKAETVTAGKAITLKNPQNGAAVVWLGEN